MTGCVCLSFSQFEHHYLLQCHKNKTTNKKAQFFQSKIKLLTITTQLSFWISTQGLILQLPSHSGCSTTRFTETKCTKLRINIYTPINHTKKCSKICGVSGTQTHIYKDNWLPTPPASITTSKSKWVLPISVLTQRSTHQSPLLIHIFQDLAMANGTRLPHHTTSNNIDFNSPYTTDLL